MIRRFKIGDRVRREAFGVRGSTGCVIAVFKRRFVIGGVHARVRVRWDSGVVGTVDDRGLVHGGRCERR